MLAEDDGQRAARAALERLRTASNAKLAARAAFLVGTLLSEWGEDETAARVALEQAATSGIATAAPAAMVNLGVLLARHDDPGQVAWFARAADTGDSEIAPYAALYLASWYHEQGDLERTRDAYQQAIVHEHPDASPGPPTYWAAYSKARVRSRRPGRPGSKPSTPATRAIRCWPRLSLATCSCVGGTGSTPRQPGSRPASSRH